MTSIDTTPIPLHLPPIMFQPMVSTIIPVYNGQDYISEAIESALSQVDDAGQPVSQEIIVVDDGSTDSTGEILDRFAATYHDSAVPVIVVHQSNAGHIVARNHGVKISRGQWLAFLDADDRWTSVKLHLQLQQANSQHPDPAVVYTERLNFGAIGEMPARQSDSQVLFDGDGPTMFLWLLETNFITVSSVLIRKEVYEQSGGFDAAPTGCEDWDLWLRLAGAGHAFAVVRQPVTEYRWLENAMSRNLVKMHHGRELALQAALSTPVGRRLSFSRRCRAWASIYQITGWVAAMSGKKTSAAWYFLRSLIAWPFQPGVVKQLIKLLFR